MATLEDIKPKIFELIGEHGTTSTTMTEALKRIPILADIAQRNLVKVARYRKTHEIVHTNDGSNNATKTYTMPSDFDGIDYIVDMRNNNQFTKTGWTLENKTLYVPNNYETTYRVVYIPILARLTAMTDSLIIEGNVVDDSLIYFIAYNLLRDTDSSMAKLYLDIWNENLSKFASNDKATSEEIIDYYA